MSTTDDMNMQVEDGYNTRTTVNNIIYNLWTGWTSGSQWFFLMNIMNFCDLLTRLGVESGRWLQDNRDIEYVWCRERRDRLRASVQRVNDFLNNLENFFIGLEGIINSIGLYRNNFMLQGESLDNWWEEYIDYNNGAWGSWDDLIESINNTDTLFVNCMHNLNNITIFIFVNILGNRWDADRYNDFIIDIMNCEFNDFESMFVNRDFVGFEDIIN